MSSIHLSSFQVAYLTTEVIELAGALHIVRCTLHISTDMCCDQGNALEDPIFAPGVSHYSIYN
jgi:hypothetical protein